MISIPKFAIFFFLVITIVNPNRKQEANDCFPADATVVLEDGTVKSMDELVIGDRVNVAPGKFSQVFLFTHSDAEAGSNFVRLTTENGEELALSEGHYLPISDTGTSLKIASAVRKGDFVTLASGVKSKVTKISRVEKVGLYNPQTLNGNVVVNGILASTFTSSVDPKLAQAALSPLRACFAKLGGYNINFNHGVASYIGGMLETTGMPVVA